MKEAPDWQELEKKVAAASRRLEQLGKEKRNLERRVRKLERELQVARESSVPTATTERIEEVRDRLRRLEGNVAGFLS